MKKYKVLEDDFIYSLNYLSMLNVQVLNIHIYQPLRSSRIWHKVNFKRSLTGLNSEFSFS